MTEELKAELGAIKDMDVETATETINQIKEFLKTVSPFANEPVDCVQWVKEELVIANDYNPNTVAPPGNGIITHLHTRGRVHATDSCLSTRWNIRGCRRFPP